MTACVGNDFRLASLPPFRKITEYGNYCKAPLDLERFLPVTGTCSGQGFSLCLRFAAWLCIVPLAAEYPGRILCEQLHNCP